MKKIILLFVIVSAFTISSCKKDRTCNCTTTTVYSGSSNVETTVRTVGHATSSEGKRLTNCYSYKATITESGSAVQSNADCTLK